MSSEESLKLLNGSPEKSIRNKKIFGMLAGKFSRFTLERPNRGENVGSNFFIWTRV